MNRKILALGLVVSFAGAGLVACEKSETEGKPNVTAKAPSTDTTAKDTTAKETTGAAAKETTPKDGELPKLDGLAVDTSKSKIDFVGAKAVGDHAGGFKKFVGAIKLDDAGKLSNIAFVVDTTSVFSDDERLTGHLKQEDFFHTEKHSRARFDSTKIEEGSDVKPGEGQAAFTHTITGNLDLRGVKKEITFPARVDTSGDMVKASTEFNLNRFDFGIEYKGKADNLIKKEVLLKIAFEAPKK